MLIDVIATFYDAKPVLTSVGAGTLVTASVHGALSIYSGAKRGSNFAEQFRSIGNLGWGLLAGGATGYIMHKLQIVQDPMISQGLQYLGVASVGAAAGSLLRPAFCTLKNSDGFPDNFRRETVNGAMRGVVGCVAGYAALDMMMRYLR